MEKEEIWLPVRGWELSYEVSSRGQVRSIDRLIAFKRAGENRVSRYPGKLLKPQLTMYGYPMVILSEEPRRMTTTIHIIVCSTFHGPKPDPSFEVGHLNGVRTDNREENLRWVSPKENQAHRRLHGTHLEGEDAPGAKLTIETVKEIRLRAAGGMRLRDICKNMGLPRSNVWAIIHRKSWRHVA